MQIFGLLAEVDIILHNVLIMGLFHISLFELLEEFDQLSRGGSEGRESLTWCVLIY